jgi:hypothetical protein
MITSLDTSNEVILQCLVDILKRKTEELVGRDSREPT